MEISVKREGSRSVIYVSDDVDLSSAPSLRETILELFQKRKQKTVIVDLSNVHHIDSSCIAILMEGLQAAKQSGGRLVLVGLNQGPRHVLELSGLVSAFEIYPTEQDATA